MPNPDVRTLDLSPAGGSSLPEKIKAAYSFIAALLVSVPQRYLLVFFIGAFFFGIPGLVVEGLIATGADFAFFLLAPTFFSFLLLSRNHRAPALAPDARSPFNWLLVFFLWSVFSAVVNVPLHSFAFTCVSAWFVIKLFELPVCLYIFSSKEICRFREQMLDAILGFSMFEVGYGFYQHLFQHDMRWATGTLGQHHALLGIMMIFPMCVSIYRFLVSKSRFKKVLYIGFFFVSFYGIILSGCRSILTGIGVSAAIFFFSNMKLKFRNLAILFGGLVVAALLVKFTPISTMIQTTVHSNESPFSVDMSSYGRLLIWKGTLTHFLHAPILSKLTGVGMGCFWTIPFNFFVFGAKGSSGAHNNFLHVLSETGAIGLLLFLALFSSIIRVLIRLGKTDKLALTYLYTTIALLVSGFTQETFWFQPVFGNFWLFYVVILGLVLGKTRAET